MRPVAMSDEIAVGEVPTPDEIVILARAGFRSLLNAQPDGEVARFLTAADIRKLATSAGLEYAHAPIESRHADDRAIRDFADALAWLPRPIYACCYSGARAAAGWALAMADRKPPAELAAALETAGYDTAALVPALERRHQAGQPAVAVAAAAAVAAPASAPGAPPVASAAAPAGVVSSAHSAADPKAEPNKLVVVYPRAAADGGFVVAG